MSGPICYGTIGTASITDIWIAATKHSSDWKLTAVYSRREDNAQAYASKHNVSAAYTSIPSMLADENVHAVYVASPNSLHHEHAKLVLEAKKHVILEKPATSTVAEFRELLDLAKKNNVFLLEAYRHIQEHNFRALKKALDERVLGEVYGASITFARYSSKYNAVLDKKPTPNSFSPEFSGGALVDMGVYPITFAVALFGKPLSQTYAPFICSTGVDGGGCVVLKYKSFAVQINVSKIYESWAPTEIYGEMGKIVLDAPTDIKHVTLHEQRSGSKTELGKPPANEPINLVDEAIELARIMTSGDQAEVERLQKLSLDVLEITTDLRRQNKIVYPADQK